MEPISDQFDIYSDKEIIGSCFFDVISSKLKQSLQKNLIPLEDSKDDPRDYRLAALLERGTGQIHDIVDPSFNCLENSWIATEFLINNEKVTFMSKLLLVKEYLKKKKIGKN